MMWVWCQDGWGRRAGSDVFSDVIQTSALCAVALFALFLSLSNFCPSQERSFSSLAKAGKAQRVQEKGKSTCLSMIVLQAQASVALCMWGAVGETCVCGFFFKELKVFWKEFSVISGGSCSERGSVGVQAGRSAGLAGKQRRLCAGGDELFVPVSYIKTWHVQLKKTRLPNISHTNNPGIHSCWCNVSFCSKNEQNSFTSSSLES